MHPAYARGLLGLRSWSDGTRTNILEAKSPRFSVETSGETPQLSRNPLHNERNHPRGTIPNCAISRLASWRQNLLIRIARTASPNINMSANLKAANPTSSTARAVRPRLAAGGGTSPVSPAASGHAERSWTPQTPPGSPVPAASGQRARDEAAVRTLLCGHPASENRWRNGDQCNICEKRCKDEAAPGIALAKSGDLQALEKWLLDNIDQKDSIQKGGVTKAGTRHYCLLRRLGSHRTPARVLCSPRSSCGSGSAAPSPAQGERSRFEREDGIP